jgi:hypothetical protein
MHTWYVYCDGRALARSTKTARPRPAVQPSPSSRSRRRIGTPWMLCSGDKPQLTASRLQAEFSVRRPRNRRTWCAGSAPEPPRAARFFNPVGPNSPCRDLCGPFLP